MKTTIITFIFLISFIPAFPQNSGYVENGDCKTYFRTFGTGKPILIINGGPGMNSDGFVTLAKTLSKNNQTIIYDQRGTGKSVLDKMDGNTITMKLMNEDIERLRTHLKIEKWIILGHSFGGMMASYYATIHPERIESLILSSSGGIDLELLSNSGQSIMSRLSAQETDSLNYWNRKIEDGDTSFNAKLHRGMALAPAYLFDRKYIPVIAERLTQSNMKVNAIVWNDLQRIKFDCSEKLKSFTAPVLIIQGKQDIIEDKIALKAQNTLKNSRVIIIDKCSHYGWLDQPDRYFTELNKFITGV